MTIRILEAQAPRPEIKIGVDVEAMVDESIASLCCENLGIYQRAGYLVRVVPRPTEPSAKTNAIPKSLGSPVILPMGQATLREKMCTAARWVRLDGKTRDWKQTLPPDAVVNGVLTRGFWRGVRPLSGVTTSPTLRPDGTVLQNAGYDKATGFLYMPSASYPEVADRPSRDDAINGVGDLLDIFCDFPFARDEHRSACLAGVLTMVARAAIKGPVPLFAVDATTRATGKSRMVDACFRLVYGHSAPRMTFTPDNEEMRKVLTSVILEGDLAVCLDNVNSKLRGPALEAAITSDTWKDRPLGKTAMASAPNHVVFWVTANNLNMSSDIARRCLHIRLESHHENPEDREGFKYPRLLEHISSDRHRLVAIALTILRAYAISGATKSTKPWGSFECWSDLVAECIVWLGMPSPLKARASNEDLIDDDKRHVGAVLLGLRALDPDGIGMTTKQILRALYPELPKGTEPPPDTSFMYEPLREALEDVTYTSDGRRPDPRRAGHYFRSIRGRTIEGLRLETAGEIKHAVRWRVVGLT